jgi:hypothetical protein
MNEPNYLGILDNCEYVIFVKVVVLWYTRIFLIKVKMFVKIFYDKNSIHARKSWVHLGKKMGGNFDVKKVICISHSVVF